jgi:hypothetical protein
MKTYSFLYVLLGTLVATTPGVVHAQEGAQTVENAQKFLSIVLPGNGYLKGSVSTSLAEAIRTMRQNDPRNYYEGDVHGEAKIVDASAVSRCKSKLLSDYSSVEIEFRMRRNSQAPVLERHRTSMSQLPDAFPASSGGVQRHGTQEGFPWSDVKSVEAVGGDVRLMMAGNQAVSTIHLRSSDLATRVAYAIEFLRTQCDAAAGTGF